MSRLFSAILKLNLKTLFINFSYFSFKDAIKLPIFVSRKVKLMETKGSIQIMGEIKTGMIQIGYSQIGLFDKKYSRSILELKGSLVFRGNAKLGSGCKVNVGTGATLTIGDNLQVTAESSIACHKRITLGENCLISWEAQIMDTDFHAIKNSEGEIINSPQEIIVGDNVWIGSRCTILKGSVVPEGSIVATGSIVNKVFNSDKILIGGSPAKLIASQVSWRM